ncbi:hypothetical protein PPERSA_08511 [Pseudocohnilembus persalinus]|uniref:Uncharacterized protein n=1 Tax=Pseudocohnilembus persalinus TaxID=266149 RepID=A0A0V0R6K8_PSEPJ|nr:hypothetical protein PPERSA_08511 [Pseudocohnilembus persalinus]|eukprot:KRX10108.1 hypothetical protein PPERSA_08511 [Pseudocohnilembus persalinus]
MGQMFDLQFTQSQKAILENNNFEKNKNLRPQNTNQTLSTDGNNNNNSFYNFVDQIPKNKKQQRVDEKLKQAKEYKNESEGNSNYEIQQYLKQLQKLQDKNHNYKNELKILKEEQKERERQEQQNILQEELEWSVSIQDNIQDQGNNQGFYASLPQINQNQNKIYASLQHSPNNLNVNQTYYKSNFMEKQFKQQQEQQQKEMNLQNIKKKLNLDLYNIQSKNIQQIQSEQQNNSLFDAGKIKKDMTMIRHFELSRSQVFADQQKIENKITKKKQKKQNFKLESMPFVRKNRYYSVANKDDVVELPSEVQRCVEQKLKFQDQQLFSYDPLFKDNPYLACGDCKEKCQDCKNCYKCQNCKYCTRNPRNKIKCNKCSSCTICIACKNCKPCKSQKNGEYCQNCPHCVKMFQLINKQYNKQRADQIINESEMEKRIYQKYMPHNSGISNNILISGKNTVKQQMQEKYKNPKIKQQLENQQKVLQDKINQIREQFKKKKEFSVYKKQQELQKLVQDEKQLKTHDIDSLQLDLNTISIEKNSLLPTERYLVDNIKNRHYKTKINAIEALFDEQQRLSKEFNAIENTIKQDNTHNYNLSENKILRFERTRDLILFNQEKAKVGDDLLTENYRYLQETLQQQMPRLEAQKRKLQLKIMKKQEKIQKIIDQQQQKQQFQLKQIPRLKLERLKEQQVQLQKMLEKGLDYSDSENSENLDEEQYSDRSNKKFVPVIPLPISQNKNQTSQKKQILKQKNEKQSTISSQNSDDSDNNQEDQYNGNQQQVQTEEDIKKLEPEDIILKEEIHKLDDLKTNKLNVNLYSQIEMEEKQKKSSQQQEEKQLLQEKFRIFEQTQINV